MTAATTTASGASGGGREEIRKAMSSVGLILTPEVLTKCLALATSLRVTPSRMAESWEAHSLNRNVTDLNSDTFEGFRAALRKDADASPRTTAEGLVRTNPAMGKRKAGGDGIGGGNVVTPMMTPKKKNGAGAGGSDLSAVDAVAVSPTSSPKAPKRTKAAPAVVVPTGLKYDQRTGVGKVVASFNPRDLPAFDAAAAASSSSSSSAASSGRRRCQVTLPPEFPNVAERYRYMFNPPEDRAEALDDRLVEMGEVLMEKFGIRASDGGSEEDREDGNEEEEEDGKLAPLEAVGRPRQTKVCCVGRICNEAHSGRLNRTSLVLEGSRHHSRGSRVPLEVEPLTSGGASYSLFPGQIVAVEGVNSSGFKMVARRVCEGCAPPPPAPVSSRELLEYHHGDAHQGGKPLRMMVASGPYTSSDNLDYDPLNDLLAKVREENPDVVFLTGPFVDLRQPLVKNGDVSLGLEGEGSDGGAGGRMFVTHETLFVEKVARTLEELYEGMVEDGEGRELRTQFVLVPSLDDANADFVYPQPPMADRLPNGGKELNLPGAEGITYGTLGLQHIETAGLPEGISKRDLKKRIHLVPNPCTLRINELTIGVTSTDVLLHMSQDEANANLEPGSRMTRLAQHLVQQRSYYPLFPPPAPGPGISPPNLDLKRMDGYSMPVQPDVLLVPSRLAAFARPVLGRTVAINPGLLSRGTTGGTYAVMDVHPARRETLEESADANGGVEAEQRGVQDRIRVEVKRI